MKTRLFLSGSEFEMLPADLDGDGKVGGVEGLSRGRRLPQPAKETTEMGEVLSQMNKDEVGEDHLASIDFLGRIHPAEMVPLVVFDSLIGMGMIPENCGILTRVKMRKSVSDEGKGRGEYERIAIGRQENEREGFGTRVKNLFTGGGSNSD